MSVFFFGCPFGRETGFLLHSLSDRSVLRKSIIGEMSRFMVSFFEVRIGVETIVFGSLSGPKCRPYL